MSEDKQTQEDEAHRASPPDPRLVKPEQLNPMALAGVIAGLVGGIALIVGLLWWLVIKTFGIGPKVFVIVAAVCLIFALVTSFSSLIASFRQRRVVTGVNTAVFAVVVLGILVLVNVIATRHRFFRYDATESKQFSLSPQTIKVLRSLDKDVEASAFFSPEYSNQQVIRDRLEEYSAYSPRFKLAFYDPTTRVDKVREFNITMDGTVVLKSGEKKEEVLSGDEERLTSALLAVSQGAKTKVYFLIGHGEADPNEFGQDTVSTIKRGLESQQYSVETLTLLNQEKPKIPQDCAALVIGGAKHPLGDKELKAVEKYADQGGKLFIALANTPDAPDFVGILGSRGVRPMKGKIHDPNAEHHYRVPEIPAVMKPEKHEVTEQLQGLVLPMARGLEIEMGEEPPPSYPGAPPPPPSQKATELLRTSAEAWSDAPDASGQGNGVKDGDEQSGPFAMAAAIDESKQEQPPQQPGMPPPPPDDEEPTGTRIVVVGDAEFMTDRLVSNAQIWANGAFVLNSIAWLVSNEKLISIPPKESETPYLTMVGAQKAVSAVIALFLIPGAIILAGGIVWWRRRR